MTALQMPGTMLSALDTSFIFLFLGFIHNALFL